MSKLSATMVCALDFAREHGGKLVRHQGGFWAGPGWRSGGGEWFGTQTVESLVKRGHMRFTAFKANGRGDFPVEVELTEQATQ